MSIIMRQTNFAGGRDIVCDSRCHAAKKPHCKCICGGRFHGLGLVEGRLDEELKLAREEGMPGLLAVAEEEAPRAV